MTDTGEARRRILGPDDWAGEMGQKWLEHLDQFETMIAAAGQALLDHAAFAPGDQVLDIGPGGGATSLAIATLVGDTGTVTGLDISPQLVAHAQRRAGDAGLSNVHFEVGDASVAVPTGAPFDRLVSRFGCMFFADPYPAYAHLHQLVKPGGRVDLAVWQLPKNNEWLRLQAEIIERHVDLPPPVPRAPGPVAMGDPDYARDLLEKGGFKDISIIGWTGEQLVGGAGATAQDAADFVLSAHSMGQLLALEPDAVKQKARAELCDLYSTRQTPRGVVMEAQTWLISARA